jgi:FkbM family methyltransferase
MEKYSTNSFEKFRSLCQSVNETKYLVKDRPVLIFGAGKFGIDLCGSLLDEGFNVKGFVTSKPNQNKIFGLSVFSWEQLQSEQRVQVAVAIFNRDTSLNTLKIIVESNGYTDIFMPWDLFVQFESNLGWRYWLSKPDIILDNLDRIEHLYCILADEKSKKCLLDICAFRLGKNIEFASFTHNEQQYFNDITLSVFLGKQVVYVDGGAFNGDTYLEILKKIDVSMAYLFEPDSENYFLLKDKLMLSGKRALCFPLGLAEKHDFLSFSGGCGEAGTITEEGSIKIATVSLDEIFKGQHIVDFLKLDVEGAEIMALQGASVLINDSLPVMAISLYHLPEDLWKIPEQILSICKFYKLYIRQHRYNSFDSVLYAIPHNRMLE